MPSMRWPRRSSLASDGANLGWHLTESDGAAPCVRACVRAWMDGWMDVTASGVQQQTSVSPSGGGAWHSSGVAGTAFGAFTAATMQAVKTVLDADRRKAVGRPPPPSRFEDGTAAAGDPIPSATDSALPGVPATPSAAHAAALDRHAACPSHRHRPGCDG